MVSICAHFVVDSIAEFEFSSPVCLIFARFTHDRGVRGGTVDWGTALQVGRSRVRFPMVSLEFFIDVILPAALWPWGWLSLQQKWVPGIFPGGWRRPVRRADNLTNFICRLSWNLEASTSWNPQGLSRHVMVLLYLLLMIVCELSPE
jgi:hypothetical protein